MATEKIFEAALGIASPWYIAGINFEESQKKLRIRVDFEVGSRFAVPGQTDGVRGLFRSGLYSSGTVGETRPKAAEP